MNHSVLGCVIQNGHLFCLNNKLQRLRSPGLRLTYTAEARYSQGTPGPWPIAEIVCSVKRLVKEDVRYIRYSRFTY